MPTGDSVVLREPVQFAKGEGCPVSDVVILGTGKMGAAIARRLAATGLGLTLWNRSSARAEAVGVGSVADSLSQAVGSARILITSLTGPDALRETLLGPAGALAGASGHLIIEMSTAGPDILAELAPAVRASGSRMIDAPILAPPRVVEEGNAPVIVGGDAEDVSRARPVLDLLGPVRHVGPLGAAARLKLVSNAMLAQVLAGAAELQVAGESAGLAPDDVFFVLARLVPSLEGRRAGYVADGVAPPTFALRDLLKDLDLGLGLFRDLEALVPLSALVRELVGEAAAGYPADDVAAVIRLYRASRPAHEAPVRRV